MNIVFMGTPDFAVPCLKALVDAKHNVQAVFTQPDKPRGRGNKLVPTPVKKFAIECNIPVYQPTGLRKGNDAESSLQVLQELNPDLIVVVAYGQILPKSILDLPKYRCINIHASLLPKYRGAGPIQRCILDGETLTGVTSMYMEEGLDTGDMLIKEEITIGKNMIADELHDALSEMGAKVLLKTIQAIEDGSIVRTPQDDSKSTYAKMITKEMSHLDFSKSAQEVHNIIRGITGFTSLNGKRLKVFRSEILEKTSSEPFGTIVDTSNFTVVCGDGKCIKFNEVQLEGSKRMDTKVFLRGKKLDKTILGE
ncbi:MAG: methionyl-tRNA formyltransferase [Oscillospiraceae bacterium]